MRKTILLMIFGWNTPAPIAIAVSSPTSELTRTEPRLIAEIKLETQTGTAYTLSWSPDGKTLAAASGGEITLISEDLSEIQTILKPEGGALGVTWGPDETQFATVNGFRNPIITIWDWDNSESQLTRSQQIQAVADQYGVAWSPDGTLLATLAGDQKSVIQIWDVNTGAEIRTFELPYTNPHRALNWSADSSKVYGAGQINQQIAIFFALDTLDGSVRELGKFITSEAEVFAISPDEDRIAVSDARGVAQILDIASGEVLTGFISVDQPVDLAWNPNGMTLAILDYKTILQLWEIPQ
jgi:WD40 repeat protein